MLSRFAVMEQTWNTFEGVIFARREALDRQFLFGSFEKAVKDFKSTYVELQARNYPKPDGHVSNHPFVRFFK